MASDHGEGRLAPMPVRVGKGSEAFEADLYLPAEPWGAVVFGGAWHLHPGFAPAMLEAVVRSQLAVLAPRFGADEGSEFGMLQAASRFLDREPWTAGLAQGLFGCGALAAPVLRLAAEPPDALQAVIIYEGSADMSEADLEEVQVPSLFVAGSSDPVDAELHEAVSQMLHCESRLILLDQALAPPRAAVEWFIDHFKAYYRGSLPHRRALGRRPQADGRQPELAH